MSHRAEAPTIPKPWTSISPQIIWNWDAKKTCFKIVFWVSYLERKKKKKKKSTSVLPSLEHFVASFSCISDISKTSQK